MMPLKYLVAALPFIAFSAAPALANRWWWWNPSPAPTTPTAPVSSVPEIDASTAMLAAAAIAATLAFVWERSRRRA